jgi:flavin-dependent dehydrogenase
MEIHFVDEVFPGYFWIFPVGNGRANVGAGMFEDRMERDSRRKRVNLREMIRAVTSRHPRFRDRFGGARELEGSFRGWQLPCGSERRRIAGDAWMLIGDAAALIDPFSGEGIANAMISAKLAAECAVEALAHGTSASGGLLQYEERVRRELGSALATSTKIQRLARMKWLLDFVLKRASSRPHALKAIHEIIADREQARKLTSPFFYLKLLFA